MNCCDDNGQCTQGANFPVRKPAPSYKPNSDYIGQEQPTACHIGFDIPPMGYSHDFIAILSILIVGIVLGVAVTILFLLV